MARYASDADVTSVLGQIGGRLPSWVVVATYASVAHTEVVELLGTTYPNGVPAFGGDGLEVIRWAEAKLAAAEILEAIRINLPDLGKAPEQLRESALSALAGGVVDYPPGSTTDPDDPTTTYSPSPRMSSFTPASAFPDPYEALRGTGIEYL